MRFLVRSFFRGLRAVLTPFVLLGEMLTTPKGIHRDPDDQARVDAQTEHLAVFQFAACPFCVKVRRSIKRLSLRIELLDAQSDPKQREELLTGGGRIQVPCLRISHPDGQIEWLYESDEIIRYLDARFGPASTVG